MNDCVTLAFGDPALPKNALIKIEVSDPETGGRVTVMVNGAIPKSLSESIGRYISSVLSSRGALAEEKLREGSSEVGPMESISFSSTFDRVRFLLVKHFRYGSFTSRDVQDEYERLFKAKLRGSTVSTYLLRLADPASGILERRHGVGGFEYLLRSERAKDEIAQIERMRPPKNPTK
nr:hypothetical protein [Candidatus Njordarchaeota archaeon]